MIPNQMDKVTKEILENSLPEWDDPDFNSTTMNSILREADRRIRRRLFLSLFSIIVAIVLSGLFLFKILSGTVLVPEPALRQISPLHSFLAGIREIADWIMGNEYFILPLLSLLVIKKLIDSRVKYN
jgi:hypothetical protein